MMLANTRLMRFWRSSPENLCYYSENLTKFKKETYKLGNYNNSAASAAFIAFEIHKLIKVDSLQTEL